MIGRVGSGKSQAAEILEKTHGYVRIHASEHLAKLLDVPPIPKTPRKLLQELGRQFITSPNGAERLAQSLWRECSAQSGGRIVVDGIRTTLTLRALRRLARGYRVATLFVHTTPDVAYRFFAAREDKSCSIDDFISLRDAYVEATVDESVPNSDAILYNWTGKTSFRRAIRSILTESGRLLFGGRR